MRRSLPGVAGVFGAGLPGITLVIGTVVKDILA